jgi:hypothetical protein
VRATCPIEKVSPMVMLITKFLAGKRALQAYTCAKTFFYDIGPHVFPIDPAFEAIPTYFSTFSAKPAAATAVAMAAAYKKTLANKANLAILVP